MSNDYSIYLHTFPNGKHYVGITCQQNINRRWQGGRGYVTQLVGKAIAKYGWDNITHVILKKGLSRQEATEAEIKYIQKYNSADKRYGYNISLGGEAGGHMAESTKKKIGDANRGENNGMFGHVYTEEERKAQAIRSKGRTHTEEYKHRMSEYWKAHPETRSHPGKSHPLYGTHPSNETRQKQSDSAKRRGCCMKKETRERLSNLRSKAVEQYTIDGDYVATYKNAGEASKAIGLKSKSKIVTCAETGIGTSGGYKWRYKP